MRNLIIATMVCLMAPMALAEGEFAEGSAAKEWGLLGEEKATFSAKVVDLLCEVTGDCPANCGDGKRQLGLLRAADGALVLPMKNSQAVFTGAATDLQPYCGKDVDVDGVLVGDEDQTPTKFYMVQFIREAGAEEWQKANQWTKEWARLNPELKDVKGPWFRRDPRVNAKIAATGYLGLGQEADEAFIEYYFE
ncbi:MAG: hypothetical protein AAF367_20885 [Pseudomonadota bacterium]